MPGGGSGKAPQPPRPAGANKGRNSPLRRFHGSGSGGSGKPSENKMRMEAASRALAGVTGKSGKPASVRSFTADTAERKRRMYEDQSGNPLPSKRKQTGKGRKTVATVTAGP